MISVNDTKQLIYLGIQGETEARTVEFDFGDWVETYGVGTLMLYNQRNGEDMVYPVPLEVENNVATWIISELDVALSGFGLCQLKYKVNDTVVKSATFRTSVDYAIGSINEPDGPYDDILDEIDERLTEANELVDEAVETVSAITNLTVDAENGTAASVEKQVDPETGEINLHFTLPKGDTGEAGPQGEAFTYEDFTPEQLEALKGPKGDAGEAGHTPEMTASKVGTTTTIYADGEPIVTIDDGDDGHSPVITASKSGKVTTIFLDGTAIATISDGQNGNDGHSPVITATKTGTVTTIYSDGSAIGTVNDGDDYILTNQDKQDIADIVISELPTWTGGNY